jgi:hypothetical protein
VSPDHNLPGTPSPPKDFRHNKNATKMLEFMDRLQRRRPDKCQLSQEDKNKGRAINPMEEGYYFNFTERQFRRPFQEQVRKAVQLSNVLNSLFLISDAYRQYSASPSSSNVYQNATFLALVHNLVESDPKVKGCGIVFVNGSYKHWHMPYSVGDRNGGLFFPYAYRTKSGDVVLSDLSNLYSPYETAWFRAPSTYSPAFSRSAGGTVLATKSDVGLYQQMFDMRWNKTVRSNESRVYWAPPYYDCMLETWITQFSVPFYEVRSQAANPTFK